MTTPEDRKARSRGRREVTRIVSDMAVKEFLSCFYFHTGINRKGKCKAVFNGTPTRELAALCKASHKIASIAAGAQIHLDKRHHRAKAERAKLQGNV